MRQPNTNIVLTPDAVERMIQEKEGDITVQVINLKKMKASKRISCDLSDGIFKIKAFITNNAISENDTNAFIKVISYGLLKQDDKPVGIYVDVCEILDYYQDKLGNPVDFLKERPSSFNDKAPQIDKSKLRSNSRLVVNEKQDEESKRDDEIEEKELKSSKQTFMKTPTKEIRLDQVKGEIDNFEKISDLYPDFPNWQIVARLVKKNYKEFISKSGKGKQTKVLNMDFMDSAGFKISGALFGDSAIHFNEALKENEIYQISKGQIREDQYSQNKGKNYSRYSIMFNRQSEFKLCVNTDLVPENVNVLQDLLSISEDRRIGEEYDAVGIVVFISDEVEIPKDNRTLYKQTLEICDPKNELRMDCIIWNKNIPIDERILNKAIGLFGFRLSQFNEKLSLNSSHKSEIKILNNHEYNKYESKKLERNRMEPLSEKKDRNGGLEIEENLKNLKELESEVAYIEEGTEIKSTLNLTLSFITNKSWFYESCPNCRKSAESMNRCPNCDKYIEETIPRWKLNVELSDYCGSIWATGFEEFGAKIFGSYVDGIKGIKNLEEIERQRLFEKHQFQELTVKIISKFDRDRQIKHTINRVYDVNLGHKIAENIKRINNIK